jgi:hypothetical protein
VVETRSAAGACEGRKAGARCRTRFRRASRKRGSICPGRERKLRRATAVILVVKRSTEPRGDGVVPRHGEVGRTEHAGPEATRSGEGISGSGRNAFLAPAADCARADRSYDVRRIGSVHDVRHGLWSEPRVVNEPPRAAESSRTAPHARPGRFDKTVQGFCRSSIRRLRPIQPDLPTGPVASACTCRHRRQVARPPTRSVAPLFSREGVPSREGVQGPPPSRGLDMRPGVSTWSGPTGREVRHSGPAAA